MKKKHNALLNKILVAVIAVLMIGILLALFLYQQIAIASNSSAANYNTYDRHYVIIPSEGNDALWQSLYESALARGRESGAYVELFGSDLAVSYSRNELLQMAIDASVDGIILEGDESEETIALIDEAVTAGIPVVTVLGDSTGSLRQSYVGVNSYTVGQEYGSCVQKLLGESPASTQEDPVIVKVVLDNESEDSSQNRILMGIRETLNELYPENYVNVESVTISSDDDFAMEEYMRDLFLSGELPACLICLDSISTTQAYTAAVDYNAVGYTSILGYYDSETILSAVSKGVVSYTLSMDAGEMGSLCVDALEDYVTTGYTNGYLSVDFTMLDGAAAQARLDGEEGEDE